MEGKFRKKLACLIAVLLFASLTALSVVPSVVGHEGHGMPPIVTFSATPTNGTKPLIVSFTATAYYGGNPPFTYALDFGDGTTSTSEQNPGSYVTSHTYQNTGTYMAKVWETDAQGAFATNYVQIFVTEIAVSASAMPTNGTKPLTVNFTATLVAGVSPITYAWDFGDGTTSTEQNPSHTYQNNGEYSAWVTATDATGAFARDSVKIIVTEITVSALPTSGTKPLTVNFNATVASTSAQTYTYRWDFGDGTTSTEQNPSHTYQNTGEYTAWVTATDTLGSSVRAPVQIVVNDITVSAIPEIAWALIGVVVIIMIAAGVLLVKRRR